VRQPSFKPSNPQRLPEILEKVIPHFRNHKRVAVRKMSGGLSHTSTLTTKPVLVLRRPPSLVCVVDIYRHSVQYRPHQQHRTSWPQATRAASASAAAALRPLSLGCNARSRAAAAPFRAPAFVAAGDGICVYGIVSLAFVKARTLAHGMCASAPRLNQMAVPVSSPRTPLVPQRSLRPQSAPLACSHPCRTYSSTSRSVTLPPSA
jgi:hypothetical protein